MNEAIRTRGPGVMVVAVLLAVLLLLAALVFVLRPAATGSDPVVRATSAGGGSDFTQDPYFVRHAVVVARHHDGGVR
jgi:hypothetical protein